MYGSPDIHYYGVISQALIDAYELINKTQYQLHDLPGKGEAVLSGPIDHKAQDGIVESFHKAFDENGLTIELKPVEDPQYFVARFNGAAYAALKNAERAYEAKYPSAIGH